MCLSLFDLSADDIDLDDLDEKPKGNNVMALLNKQKLASKFQSFKGEYISLFGLQAMNSA